MEFIWGILLTFIILITIVLIIGGGVLLFLKIRAREPVNLNLRYLVRIYLLVVTVAGLLVITQGASNLLRAGFASMENNQFSYEPVYVSLPSDDEIQPQNPLELKDPQLLSDEELVQLSDYNHAQATEQLTQEAERRRLGLEEAKEDSLIEGFTYLFMGILILVSHFGGRYWLESAEEKESLLSRGYLVFVTVTFGIITIVFLPQAVSETFEYILDDPVGMYDDDRSGPGGKLALSITTLPIWLIYLSAVIRTMRRKSI